MAGGPSPSYVPTAMIVRVLTSFVGAAVLVVAAVAVGAPAGSSAEELAADAGTKADAKKPDPPPAPPPTNPATCVAYWGEARTTGYGYRHVVLLSNGCKKVATCAVSTDVNPEVQTVTVAPNAIEEVVTFLEAPGATFTPKVSCKLAP